ncbi:MAG: hypothetical protein V1778_03550 [bacterium]
MRTPSDTPRGRLGPRYHQQTLLHLFVIGVVFLPLLFWQTPLHAGQIAFGTWIVAFLPGYLFTFLLWDRDGQPIAIRCSLSVILSLPLLALPILLLSKTALFFYSSSMFVTILFVNLVLLVLVIMKNRQRHQSTQSAASRLSPPTSS